jgi:hypothetical protein
MRTFIILFFLVFTHMITKAQTYYGYKERGSSGQVNYAQIGRDFNAALTEGTRARQEKLKQNGWSSEYEYLAYKRQMRYQSKFQKKQRRLRKKYNKGSKRVYYMQNPNDGKVTYHKR